MIRAALCRVTHYIGITFSLWSMRLQGDGPGPWPQEQPPVDLSNVIWIEPK